MLKCLILHVYYALVYFQKESAQSRYGSEMAEGTDSNVKHISRMTPGEINDNLNDIQESYGSLNFSNREPASVPAGLASDMTDERQKTASFGFDPEKQLDEKTGKEILSTQKKAPNSDGNLGIDEMVDKMDSLNIGSKHEAEPILTVQPSINSDKGYSKSVKDTNGDQRPSAGPQHVTSQGYGYQTVPNKASEICELITLVYCLLEILSFSSSRESSLNL